MNAWQLDLMKDQQDGKEWEKLNAPDPCENALKNAAVGIREAEGHLNTAVEMVNDAAAFLNDTPMQAKVLSLMDQIEEIGCDLRAMYGKYERGVRE